MQGKFIYKCNDCGKEYNEDEVKYLCPVCSKNNSKDKPPKGVLKVIYNYEKIKTKGSNDLFSTLKDDDFIELLPIAGKSSLAKLSVGNTPMYSYFSDKNESYKLPFNLHLKDDSGNPTFSFKDRASYIVSAYAKEKGYETIVAASTGNAGSSLAGICASQGQKAIILVPESAPIAKLTQIMMYGAKIVPVKGTYDDAFDLSIDATNKFGWYNRNTAFNPHTIEGKKTVSFEIFDRLNETIPDRVFVPVGDGAIISGVYKGFEDLLKLGLINKVPVIVAVQSEKSDNISRNLDNDVFEVKESSTIADSISVDIPRNFFMTQSFIKKYKGEHITVSDEQIIKASGELAKNTGLFSEPAAATAFAGLLLYQKQGKIQNNSDNVVLLTGSGLKDLKSVQSLLKMPKAILPNIDLLKE